MRVSDTLLILFAGGWHRNFLLSFLNPPKGIGETGDVHEDSKPEFTVERQGLLSESCFIFIVQCSFLHIYFFFYFILMFIFLPSLFVTI